jgi:hypothetical protein
MTTAPLPLVVDLDDTLVRTDTLVESAVLLATRAPRKFAAQLPHLFDGRAAFKSALADAAKLDCTTLPYNKDIIAFLEKRKAAGGAVWAGDGSGRPHRAWRRRSSKAVQRRDRER